MVVVSRALLRWTRRQERECGWRAGSGCDQRLARRRCLSRAGRTLPLRRWEAPVMARLLATQRDCLCPEPWGMRRGRSGGCGRRRRVDKTEFTSGGVWRVNSVSEGRDGGRQGCDRWRRRRTASATARRTRRGWGEEERTTAHPLLQQRPWQRLVAAICAMSVCFARSACAVSAPGA